MEITWVYPNEVVDVWSVISPGLNKAIQNSDNLVSEEHVKYMLSSGQWQLFLVTGEDAKYYGFAVVETLTTERGMWYNIPFAYSDDPNVDLHKDFLPFLEELAKKRNYVGVTFISKRKGYERKVKDLGYSVQFVKFKKEI